MKEGGRGSTGEKRAPPKRGGRKGASNKRRKISKKCGAIER